MLARRRFGPPAEGAVLASVRPLPLWVRLQAAPRPSHDDTLSRLSLRWLRRGRRCSGRSLIIPIRGRVFFSGEGIPHRHFHGPSIRKRIFRLRPRFSKRGRISFYFGFGEKARREIFFN